MNTSEAVYNLPVRRGLDLSALAALFGLVDRKSVV